MIIATADASDLSGIMALEACFDHGRWSELAWAEDLTSPHGRVLVARDDASLAGVATWRCVAGAADLNRIIVAPGRRGEGIGRRLLDAGLAWADAAGADQVMLEVEDGNAAALALYERSGFVTLARRQDYYGTGRDALVMALNREGAA
ncbi:MAG: GNAT family N-acetyltransferase [Nigerium sp.]|nr:GNAT family N-acetyltransferase [Nigerium sp.]